MCLSPVVMARKQPRRYSSNITNFTLIKLALARILLAENTATATEKFICKIYGVSEVDTCNKARVKLICIGRTQETLPPTACRTIVHALVMSRLDYCNAVLYGLPDTQLQKLQLVQNAAARLVTGTHRREHITPVLFDLHWLPIRQRIQFKLLLLVYRCIHQLAPAYLMDLVVPYVPTRSLRSAEQNLLTVKRYNLERFGRRSFSMAGPSLWNALPSAIRNSMSLSAFRSSLKTHLFREAFVTLL